MHPKLLEYSMTDKQSQSAENHPLQYFYSKISGRYDLVNRLFTMGMDEKWRKVTALACQEENPEHILDLCCGTGDLAFQIQKSSSRKIEIIGYDFSNQMLDVAREKAKNRKYTQMRFVQGDAAILPFSDNQFDAISIGFGFRNLTYQNANSDKHLEEINRVLKPGGKFCILESAVPSNFLVRFFYNLYLRMLLIPLGGLISGNWKAYRYLALSSANYYNVSELETLMSKHGLTVQKVRTFFMGAANLIIASKG